MEINNKFSTDNQPKNKRRAIRYSFTLDDIASVIGRSKQTVRNHKSGEKLDFHKLKVLFGYMRRFR